MSNLKKSFLLSSITGVFLLSNSAFAFDQFITVKFKKPVTKEFIQELNKMTNTTVVQNTANTAYKLKLGGVANQATLDKYSEMFLIMKDVQAVSPLPKEKLDDKLNPFFYMNISPDDSGNQQNNQSSGTQSNTDSQANNNMQPVPDELIVKFNKDAAQEDIDLLNQGLGGNITYMKDSDSYKIKLPESVDNDYAMNFYGNNRLVESVAQNEVAVQNQPQAQNNQKKANVQSGVAMALPLNGRDVKVTFKIGKQEQGLKWFQDIFDAQLVTKRGYQTYTLRFPKEINPKFAARAVKACSIVQSSEVVSD